MLAMAGGTVGLLLGAAGAWILGKFTGMNTTVTAWSVLLSFGFSAVVGIFFGYYPARSASQLDPIESLRYE